MKNRLFKIAIVIQIAVSFYSCVNIEQQTTINRDGSGNISLHYWTASSNLSMGDEIGGFSFSEDRIKKNFTSLNSDVNEIKIETKESDSTTHVKVKISFKDFNKLSDAAGFSKTKTEWNKSGDRIMFRYRQEKDTVSADKLASGEYKLYYSFYFPAEVLLTNGRNDEGNAITWNYTLSDLKENIEMTAEIKDEKGICGLFGIEMPLIILLGLSLMKSRKKIKILSQD